MQTGNKSDGEDEAESSSSSSSSSGTSASASRVGNTTGAILSALEKFRSNWQKELKTDVKSNKNAAVPLDNTVSRQQEAESLFKQAVQLEQRGKVYDALQFYRRAVQIDPDIEFKTYEASKIPQQTENESNNNNVATTTTTTDTTNEEATTEEAVTEDLYTQIQNDLAKQGYLILSSRDAGVITTEMHISDLPTEIILYILRWVVSSQLDMKSLEQCAAVCKGFYLFARGDDIWKRACQKVWGTNVGSLSGTPYNNWRQMFIERERIHFNGCYMNKTTYLRLGENSFQDQYYRPVQLVEYYRYIRFLPDGKVIMLTTSEEPSLGVTRLKNLNQLRSEVLRGHYRLHGETVTLVLKKYQRLPKPDNYHGGRRRGSVATNDNEANVATYYVEFNILGTQKRRFCQLNWKKYTLVQVRNKREITNEFEITGLKYPPMRFSCVRSYHSDADAPLQ